MEQGRVADSVGDERDLRFILGHVSVMDHQRVLRLALLYGEASVGLQLCAVEKPGSRHGCRQLDGEVSVFSFSNFAAFEVVLNLRAGY